MKIISKFSDYYDSGIAFGVDEALRFKRESLEIDETLMILSPCNIRHKRDGKNLRAQFYYKLLGFCGEIYPFVHTVLQEVTKENRIEIYHNIKEFYCYNFSCIEDLMKSHMLDISKVKSFDRYGYSVGFSLRFKERTKEFFDKEYLEAKKFFSKYQVPYFLLEEFSKKRPSGYYEGEYKNTLLPILKDIKFSSVKESIEAFQEISMYLGQLNTQENSTIMIEDRYLSKAKGFDCYSFKKLPQKRGKKRC